MYATPGFQLTYILCYISITCIGYTIVMTDCVFMGVCSQIIASQKDLQDMLRESVVHWDVGSAKTKNQLEVDRRIMECVTFHNRIVK